MENLKRRVGKVLNSSIDILDWQEVIDRISSWSRNRESRYVCICNVHSVVTATQDKAFHQVVEQADMATPDGAPVAWLLRRLSRPDQPRISGPDLMWRYCEAASRREESVFLLGSTRETLAALEFRLRQAFPAIRIAGSWSPPFRQITSAEDEEAVAQINASGAGTVWVSLGCPKQEKWIAEHRGRVNAVMVGVGAAFGFHAGTLTRAPVWMQHNGLEWLHRLWGDPRRLWKRYLVTNTVFLLLAARQLLAAKFTNKR